MIRRWPVTVVALVALITGAILWSASHSAGRSQPVPADRDAARPIEVADTLLIDEMTWMEVRDALKNGKDTVIVATGGIEQSGPYLVTGKHNVVLRGTTQAIARKLGNALVAPIIGFVPEGDFDPPTSWMQYPGTVGVSVATFEKLMIDVCASMRAHGFKNIVLIGDHGESQDAMRHVAELLSTKWKDGKARVIYVPEYYNYEDVDRWLEKQGIRQTDEGWHDDFGVTAIMMAVDPNSVRAPQRIKAGKFRINGVDLAPAEQTIDWGRKIIELRADATVKAIRAALHR